jgi:ParB family chromosome partitioning protein
MVDKRPALGKGLSALIPEPVAAPAPRLDVEIERLSPNLFQPRAQIDDTRLEELADSIKANGIIQPIVVRPDGDRFQIIAGERRWRAAQKAGLQRVPIVVRNVAAGEERSLLELALIENIQRENLNPIDEALAYQRLAGEFQLTQERIATAVGKDRTSVANSLRLLKLPDEVRAHVAAGSLSMGHARALLALPDADAQRRAATEVVERHLSVRETEALTKRFEGGETPAAEKSTPAPDVHTRAAEDRLRLALGTRVRIVRKGTRGRIVIEFTSEDELIRLFDQLVPEESAGPVGD